MTYNDLSLLITHYNRPESLSKLIRTFHENDFHFNKIVVSDDCSSEESQSKILELQKEFSFEYVSTPTNKGLGNNINKGQDRINTPYTLYVQEDFKPTEEFFEQFDTAYKLMEERQELDIIRFYAYRLYPKLTPFKGGFYEMIFTFWSLGYQKFYFYSDHPHLKRSSFYDKFGRYEEGLNPEDTEYRMVISFLQKKGKGLFYKKHKNLFFNQNDASEPSTMVQERKNWKRSNGIIVKVIRDVYRHLKFNYHYLFMKT